MSCSICIEEFNQRTCREMKCINKDCGESYCVQCFLRHTIDNNTNGECLFCKTEIDKDIIYQAGFKYQYDNYMKHRFDMFFSRQKSLLPQAQAVITERKEEQKRKDVYAEMRNEYKELRRIHKLETCKQKRKLLKSQMKQLDTDMHDITMMAHTQREDKSNDQNLASGERCAHENCKGFLNRQRKCLLCESYSCAKCHEPKKSINDEEHECDPNTVETVKLLSGDSKFCPNCSATIFKISGCSQMYCTACFTAFDWNTLKIVTTGVIHNPHFYEMQRQGLNGARNAGDIECGGLPHLYTFKSKILNEVNRDATNEYYLKIIDYHRFIGHVSQIEMHRFPITENNETLLENRVRFLTNEIDEKRWNSNVSREMKKVEFNKEMRILLDTFVQTATGIIQLHNNSDTPNLIETVENIEKVVIYINEQLTIVTKKYKYSPYEIVTRTNNMYSRFSMSYIKTPFCVLTRPEKKKTTATNTTATEDE